MSEFVDDYLRDGVVVIRGLLSRSQVAAVRCEIERYMREDLDDRPADAATREADGVTVRNLWRLEQHDPQLAAMIDIAGIGQRVAPLLGGTALLCGIETFNKPAGIGSGVPYHQDNAYFCQTPPDMLTVWIAIDQVTVANGPVYFIKGSQRAGTLPTKPSHVKGNSIGLAEPPELSLSEQFCGLLAPGDATIHHCDTIHHSAPNRTDQPRLGLLLVFRGAHTRTDPRLKSAYDEAAALTPPA